MRPPQPPGHMVINLKTTVMTQGGHSGVIVHSGIQSSSSYSSLNGLANWQSVGSSRFPMVETPGGTRIASAASPLPLTIGPSTSQDNLNTSWSKPSPQVPPRATSMEHLNGYREPLPTRLVPRLEKRWEPRHHQYSEPPRELRIERREVPRRPPTPPSPVYDFTGRNTPPDEFIKPSKVTLNVFDPGRRSPVPIEVGLRRSQNVSTADALINDQITTTTTVEVFRSPYDPNNPNRSVLLPPAPAPGLDDRAQLLRLDGPAYERWQNSRTETLINDRPVVKKAVNFNEKVIERVSELGEYDLTRPSGSRSPYAGAIEPPRPASSTGYQYYVPTVHQIDDRLVPPMVTRATSPYMLQSPNHSEFSMTSHPMITSSQEDIRRVRADSTLSYHEAARAMESPSNLAQLRINQNYLNGNPMEQKSPLYVEPRATQEVYRREIPIEVETRGRQPIPVDNYGYSTVDRRHSRRSKSSHRNRSRIEELRARSVSPLSRKPSWSEDPNRLPNLPLQLSPRDNTHLYQTRDLFDNIISQFNEIEMDGLGTGLLLSPMAESEESLMSETSARNDRAKADLLENNNRTPDSLDIYKIAEEFYNSRNPLMTSASADNIYALPRSRESQIYEEIDDEHIYQELDNARPDGSYSNLAAVYSNVAPEYEEIPPPLPPRRRKEQIFSPAFLSTDTLPASWLPDTPESTPSKVSTPEIPRPSSLAASSTNSSKSSSSTSSDEAEACMKSLESDGSIGTTTADSSDGDTAPSFSEMPDEEWPPPPSIMRRISRKAHPDGHVFPRITSSVATMPQLPEDKEFSSSEHEVSGGIKLSPLSSLEIFQKEPKPGSPVGSLGSNSSEDFSKELALPLPLLLEDVPYVDASPRPQPSP